MWRSSRRTEENGPGRRGYAAGQTLSGHGGRIPGEDRAEDAHTAADLGTANQRLKGFSCLNRDEWGLGLAKRTLLPLLWGDGVCRGKQAVLQGPQRGRCLEASQVPPRPGQGMEKMDRALHSGTVGAEGAAGTTGTPRGPFRRLPWTGSGRAPAYLLLLIWSPLASEPLPWEKRLGLYAVASAARTQLSKQQSVNKCRCRLALRAMQTCGPTGC